MIQILSASLLLLALAGEAHAQDDPKVLEDVPPTPEFQLQAPTPDADAGLEVADLGPGDPAPSFKADSSEETRIGLDDMKGRPALLLFASDSGVFQGFAAAVDSLDREGIRVYGVCELSKGDLGALRKRHDLAVPVLGDPNGDLACRFGMYDPDEEAIVPGLILLDAKGVIRLVVQGQEPHPEGILALIRRTKISA